MSIASLCNTTVTVYSVARTVDAFGTWTETETALYTDMPCRIQPMSGKERVIYASERNEVTHKLFCEAIYSGLNERTVVVDTSSVRYDVVSARNIDNMDHHLEVELREVKPPV